jgi:hypothetical protein
LKRLYSLKRGSKRKNISEEGHGPAKEAVGMGARIRKKGNIVTQVKVSEALVIRAWE